MPAQYFSNSILTLFILMDFPLHIDTISMDLSILHFKGSQVELSNLSLKIVFILANSADPDEMPNYGAFHLSLYCLP